MSRGVKSWDAPFALPSQFLYCHVRVTANFLFTQFHVQTAYKGDLLPALHLLVSQEII